MRKIFYIFFCLTLFSCSNKKEIIIPDTVLSMEKMASVLVDLQLIEATVNLNIANYDPKLIDNTVPLTTNIFKKNNITKEAYEESFTFYTMHPQLFGEIYKLVLNDLSKMQAAVNSEKEKDSIITKP